MALEPAVKKRAIFHNRAVVEKLWRTLTNFVDADEYTHSFCTEVAQMCVEYTLLNHPGKRISIAEWLDHRLRYEAHLNSDVIKNVMSEITSYVMLQISNCLSFIRNDQITHISWLSDTIFEVTYYD